MIREMCEMLFLGLATIITAGAFLLNQYIDLTYNAQANQINAQLIQYADYIVNNL